MFPFNKTRVSNQGRKNMKPVFEISGPIDKRIIDKLPLKANLHSFVSPWCDRKPHPNGIGSVRDYGRLIVEHLKHDFYVTDRVIELCDEEYTHLECIKCGIQGYINSRVENDGIWMENHFELYSGTTEKPMESCADYGMNSALG